MPKGSVMKKIDTGNHGTRSSNGRPKEWVTVLQTASTFLSKIWDYRPPEASVQIKSLRQSVWINRFSADHHDDVIYDKCNLFLVRCRVHTDMTQTVYPKLWQRLHFTAFTEVFWCGTCGQGRLWDFSLRGLSPLQDLRVALVWNDRIHLAYSVINCGFEIVWLYLKKY